MSIRVDRLFLADVAGAENDLVFLVGEDVGVGEAVDGGVQDGAAMDVNRANRSGPRQPDEPQRRSRTNVEEGLFWRSE